VVLVFLSAFLEALRWGRGTGFRQPLINGDFSRCAWTTCIPAQFSKRSQGCVNSGEFLKGNPKECENGGRKYFCCQARIGDTVGIKPKAPTKKDPIGVAPSPHPTNGVKYSTFFKMKEHFMDKMEEKLRKFRIWMQSRFDPWDKDKERRRRRLALGKWRIN